ncbi:MAG: DUF488 domain-containing protein [Planctomycetes bacterium]|nr:DUF488 domain-containing protein [Planctomycetota bacterium]
MKKNEIYTIGYEGKQIEEFIFFLKKFNITRLIDIREVPISRKKGFSKIALKNQLNSANIEYVHIKSLGSPGYLRDKLKSDRDYDYFFKTYSEYLAKNSNAIKELLQYTDKGTNCLMCFEKNYEKCHRSVVINAFQKYSATQITIQHI